MANTIRSRKASSQESLKLSNIQILTSLLLIIFGAAILLYGAVQEIGFYRKPNVASAASESNLPVPKPTKLYIPRLSRVLYVSDGYVAGDRWAISETGVSYLVTSAVPGEIGNAVIYGHNTKNILGGLWRVQDGDTIYVVLQSGDFVKYQVSERKEIEPTQVEILNQTADSRLTIYTCSGFLDSARYVVVARQTEKII